MYCYSFAFCLLLHVIRLSLGGRLVNLLPVAQRSVMPSQMASSTGHWSLVVSSNLTSTMKTLLKISEFPHVKNLINQSQGSPEIVKNFGVGTYGPIRRPRIPLFKGGESVIRLSLGRRLVNLSPVTQRTNAFTMFQAAKFFSSNNNGNSNPPRKNRRNSSFFASWV